MSSDPAMLKLWEWSRRHGLLPWANRLSRARHHTANVLFRFWKVVICRQATFTWNGQMLRYAFGAYNYAWRNERTIEVPIIMAQMERFVGRRILEVGNVLSHYGAPPHDILDKYDPAPDIIAADIADYVPPQSYDLLISISTMEHVGWDETPRDPDKSQSALLHLPRLVLPGGEIWVTVPVGYHPKLDRFLLSGTSGYQLWFFRRDPHLNLWREIGPESVQALGYGGRMGALGLIIAHRKAE